MGEVLPAYVSGTSSELLERAGELSTLGESLGAVQGSSRGRVVLGTEPVSDFAGQLAHTVATQRHGAVGGSFTGQRHHQRSRRGFDRERSTAARTILQSSEALGLEAGNPAANGGATHVLAASQCAAAQTGGTAQDHA